LHNKLIEHVNQLLEQLNLNCHDKLIVEKTLHELQNICQRILQENNYNSSFIFSCHAFITNSIILTIPTQFDRTFILFMRENAECLPSPTLLTKKVRITNR